MAHDTSASQAYEIPTVCIIVLCYNKLEHTIECLEQLHMVTPPDLYELIVVDNASTDGTKDYLRSLQERRVFGRLRIVVNDENLGFVRGNNQAVKQSKSKYLVFLNNDTKPQAGWLEALVRLPEEDENVAAAGAKLVYPDGRLQEAGGIIYNDASGCNYGKFQNPSHPFYNYVREVDYCSGACLLVRTNLFNALGGFDERFAPAYYEDTDICFALRDAGYRVMYQPESVVMHFEGATAGTDLTSGAKRFQEINRSKFIEKWHIVLRNQPPPSANRIDLARAAERIRGRRVLVAFEIPQMYDRSSGALRIHNLIRLLKANGNHVTYVCLNSSRFEGLDLGPYVSKLRSMGVLVYPLDEFDNPDNAFYEILTLLEYAAALLPFYYSAQRFIPMIRELSPRTRIVIDSVDIHFLRGARQQKIDGNLAAWSFFIATKNKEIDVYRGADAVLTVTERDKAQLEKYLPSPPVFSVSDPHNAVAATPGFDKRQDIVFLAGFKHNPNVDAAIYFYKEIWPLVLLQLPSITWFIVGDSPPPEIQALAGDSIVVTGYVPDLEPYLQNARVAVAPIRFGAGMKGKIACSLAQGLPAVSTSIGAEGMGLVHGSSILVADSPVEFANNIVRLYTDRSLWNSLATNGKAILDDTLGDGLIYPQFAGALDIYRVIDSEEICDISDPVVFAENVSRAYKLLVTGTPDLAEAILEKLFTANPNDDLLRINLAVIKSFTKKYVEAIELLNAVHSNSGTNFLVPAYLATVYENAGQYQLAWECLTRARQMEPSSAWLANEGANFAIKRKMYPEASECLMRACELQPLNFDIHIKYAEICVMLNEIDNALSALDRALSAARNSKSTLDELKIEKMIADLRKDMISNSVSEQRTSAGSHISAKPNNYNNMLAEADYELAVAYVAGGDKAGAAKFLAKCLSKYPADPKYQQLLDQVE